MFDWFFKHPLFQALKRNWFAMALLVGLGNAFIILAQFWPDVWGEMGAPLLRGFGLSMVGVAVSKFAYCFIDPNTKSKELHDAVMSGNAAAGSALIARAIIIGVIIVMFCSASRAAEVPVTPACMQYMKDVTQEADHYTAAVKDLGACPNKATTNCCVPKLTPKTAALPKPPTQAVLVMPILKEEVQAYWPEMTTMVSYFGAQIEQETGPCTTKSKSCWNSGAQLKTCREWGVGYYQFTAAYVASCRIGIRFDTLTETVNAYPKQLKGMSWQHWDDPRLQLRAGILKSKTMAAKITGAKDQYNRLAFLASAWNGGMGGLSNDRLSCRAVKGCDPSVWFGNVELHSLKSKVDIPGYGTGQNPFNINRTYVKNLLLLYRPKYESLDKQT